MNNPLPNRSTIWWVSAFGLLAFGIAVLAWVSTGAGHTRTIETSKPSVRSPSPGLRSSEKSRNDGRANLIAQRVTPQKNNITQPPLPSVVLGTDMSVIGTPFSTSVSSLTKCERGNDICTEVYAKLSQLAREPRDNAWASQTETNIQNQIESLGLDKFAIRNLECRTSVCAVEVSSTEGQYLGMQYYYMVKFGLSQNLATNAYETDSGVRTNVTLMTFTRQQHMCWDKPCDISTWTPP
jgi:hypothetical protein